MRKRAGTANFNENVQTKLEGRKDGQVIEAQGQGQDYAILD